MTDAQIVTWVEQRCTRIVQEQIRMRIQSDEAMTLQDWSKLPKEERKKIADDIAAIKKKGGIK